MSSSEEIQAKILKFCDDEHDRALRKDYGDQRPDPGKLIREGIRAARGTIEATPLNPDPRLYLTVVREKLEGRRASLRTRPVSDDGWDDEDGYILSGLGAVVRFVEEEEKAL